MGDRPYSHGEREGTLRVRAVVLLISNGCVALNDFVHRMGRGGLEGGGAIHLFSIIKLVFRKKQISPLSNFSAERKSLNFCIPPKKAERTIAKRSRREIVESMARALSAWRPLATRSLMRAKMAGTRMTQESRDVGRRIL